MKFQASCCRSRAGLWAVTLVLAWLAVLVPARAHAPFSGSATARLMPDRIDLEITLNGADALSRCPDCGSRDTPIQLMGFRANQYALAEAGKALYGVTAGGQKLIPEDSLASLNAERDIVFRVRYPRPPGAILFHANYLSSKESSTLLLVLATTNDLAIGQKLLTSAHPEYEVADPDALSLPGFGRGSGPPNHAPRPAAGEFFKLGVEHILTGYDHLLFLLGLLVVCRRPRTIAWVVTSFTLAHSITLGAAAIGAVKLSTRIVEPAIAASIVYVAVENLWRPGSEFRYRPALAFAFGLIHGFGFAGALQDAGWSAQGASFAVPLVAFNLGVETGQLAVAALVLPGLLWLRRNTRFEPLGPRAISCAIGVAGAVWLVLRLMAA